ncbi:MAG: HepT-like ribonuclease domain-containing protein, partial [Bacteroidia bacterium]
MTPKARKYLLDIIDAIELIDEFIKPVGSFESYEKDLLSKSAIERQLMIIGEAVNQFRNRVDEHTISHTREIVQFRNVLVHA